MGTNTGRQILDGRARFGQASTRRFPRISNGHRSDHRRTSPTPRRDHQAILDGENRSDRRPIPRLCRSHRLQDPRRARRQGWLGIRPGDQEVSLLFVGDIMLDNGPGNAVNNGKDPFEKCAKLLLDADVTVGNLECVLGKGGKQVNKTYIFRGASDSPKHLKKYFHALSLANNHALDFGPDGLIGCVDVLTKADIGFFGAGRDLQAARSGLMLDVKGRKIVLLGYNDFRKEDYQATENRAGNMPLNSDWVIEDIRTAKQAWNADIVIPFIHWGNEMNPAPTQEQRTQAKRWIDAGATAVIGGHPHVTQTIDSHRGRPIVYSLGNFVFDYYPVDPAIWYGWASRLTIPPVGSPIGSQTPEDVLIDWETITVAMDPQGLPYPVDPNE